MQKKIKYLILSQSFLLIAAFSIYLTINPGISNKIKTQSINANQTTSQSIYTNSKNTNSKSTLLSIHNYIQNNQTSKALLLVDQLYKENPNSSLSYLVAGHIFLLKDQNQLAYQNIQKASQFSDFNHFNTHLDIQLNLILNNLNYYEQNIHKINLNDPNQVIHHLIYLSKNSQFEEINEILNNNFLLQNPLLQGMKQDLDYFNTFKDGNLNMLMNLWAKTLIKNQYIHYARSLLLDAIQNDASSHNSYLLLSYCYILSENYKEALDILDKSKKIDPYNQNINFYLALLNFKENNYNQSLNYLNKLKDASFENQKIKLLGQINFYLKNYKDASFYLEKYYQKNQSDLIVIEALLDIYFEKLKDLQKAYIIVQNLEKKDQKTPNYFNILGKSYINLQNSKDAEKNFLKALNLDPNHYPSIYNYSKLKLNKGNTSEILNDLQFGLEIAKIHNDKNFINKFQNLISTLQN